MNTLKVEIGAYSGQEVQHCHVNTLKVEMGAYSGQEVQHCHVNTLKVEMGAYSRQKVLMGWWEAESSLLFAAQRIICAATQNQKLQVKLSTSPSHSILTLGLPVPALTL